MIVPIDTYLLLRYYMHDQLDYSMNKYLYGIYILTTTKLVGSEYTKKLKQILIESTKQ